MKRKYIKFPRRAISLLAASACAGTMLTGCGQETVVEEEETDDCELVAVIAAAIAASEGAVTTDGFVVRSIRRR